jgi:hypothetical protein
MAMSPRSTSVSSTPTSQRLPRSPATLPQLTGPPKGQTLEAGGQKPGRLETYLSPDTGETQLSESEGWIDVTMIFVENLLMVLSFGQALSPSLLMAYNF